jgi:signal transduction histidine kinase
LTELHREFLGRRYELRGEWEVLNREGQRLTILANAAYMVESDGRPKKVTFVVDITERRNTELQLADSVERLKAEIVKREELEKAREQVERMVRHDLKNPLNGILGVSQLLMQEDEPEQRLDLLRIVYDSGMQMLSLIDNFFDLIAMEEGTYRLQPQEFDPVTFFWRLCAEMRQVFRSDEVDLRCRFNGVPIEEAEGGRSFRAEQMQLKAALQNLVRNAFEASKAGDTVTVEVTCVDGDGLGVEIRNPAPVPEEIREHFFERYVTHGKARGTGLGTYIARLITEYHGGSIGFTTGDETGTAVRLEIPRG